MIKKFVAEPEKIREELKRINENSEMKVDMLISLRTICEIWEGLGYGPSHFIMKEEAVERQVDFISKNGYTLSKNRVLESRKKVFRLTCDS